MKLLCPSCGDAIPAGDVNVDNGLARCLRCDAVFSLLEGDSQMLLSAKNVEQPASIRLDHWGPELVLTRRWYQRDVWGLAFFCVLWDSFLVFWYALALSSLFFGAPSSDDSVVMPLLFPLIHVAVGVGLTYWVLATLLNRTTIRLLGDELEVRHGPLPWWGNRWLWLDEIDRVYATGVPAARTMQSKPSNSKCYAVLAETQDGEIIPLVSSLNRPEEAWFIQQTLASHVGLKLATR